MRFSIYQSSRQGGRLNNEDRMAYSYSRDALIMIIADGMGGHAHGEIAAQVAVKSIAEAFQRHAHPKLRNPSGFLYGALQQAHKAINECVDKQNLPSPPHTTCVACVIQDDTAWWAHVGDSRLYLFSDNALVTRTRDHSAIQLMLDEHLISESEINTHPDRNKIYSSLGGSITPEITISRPMPLMPQDRILMCTDGLWTQVTDEQIATTLFRLPPDNAVEFLLNHAERSAGPTGDNLSAIAMVWESQDETDENAITTVAMSNTTFTTQLGNYMPGAADLDEDEVERVISEIQRTIKKLSETKP